MEAAAATHRQDGRRDRGVLHRAVGRPTAAGSAASSPTSCPRAAAHIDEQIAMVRTLEEQGHTYVIDDGVYFDVSTFPRYAEFAGLDLDELATSGRVEHVEAKRHPADFALWKLTPPGVQRQQEWDSPWGRGFPGWHIECSAMATKYLGDALRHPHRRRRPHPRAPHQRGGPERVRARRAPVGAASGCTTSSSTSAARRSRSRRATCSWSTRSSSAASTRWPSATSSSRPTTASSRPSRWEAIEAAATAHRRLVGHAVDGPGRRRRARPGRGRAAPPPVLVGAGRRPQRPAGAGRRVGRRPRPRAHARPTAGPSSPTPTAPSASASPTSRRPTPTRAAPTRASTRWSPSARRPGRPRTSPRPTASATSWPPRASSSSTPPRAPPGAGL